jgi:cytoskeletal protein RodZ
MENQSVFMNQKTAKLIRKYAKLKGLDENRLKRALKSQWNSKNEIEKDKFRQEMVVALIKK